MNPVSRPPARMGTPPSPKSKYRKGSASRSTTATTSRTSWRAPHPPAPPHAPRSFSSRTSSLPCPCHCCTCSPARPAYLRLWGGPALAMYPPRARNRMNSRPPADGAAWLTSPPAMPRLLCPPLQSPILRDADNSMGAGTADPMALQQAPSRICPCPCGGAARHVCMPRRRGHRRVC